MATRDTALSQTKHGRGWYLLRAGWAALLALCLVEFVYYVPMYYHSRFEICIQHPLCDDFIQTTPGKVVALQSLSLTLSDYALFATANVVCVSLIFFACGALIAWKRWQTGLGLFVPLFCFIYGAEGMSSMLAGSIPDGGPTGSFAFLAYLSIPFLPLQYLFLSIFLLTFPTGRFQPRWSWALILLWVVNFIDFNTLTISPVITVFLAFGSCLVIQIYRYRRVYTYAQRQQVKWLVYGLGVSVFGSNILTAILLTFLPSLGADTSPLRLLDITGLAFFWLPIPLGIAIALVRYQLYDIDRLINRTVVYALLTGILAAVYFGLVFALQTAVRSLTGQESALAVVVSTLAVVALFQPLRRRVQGTIDKRFYRRKYNAEHIVAAFGVSLQSELNLDQLAVHLVQVVEETMQPANVSLWLKPPEKK